MELDDKNMDVVEIEEIQPDTNNKNEVFNAAMDHRDRIADGDREDATHGLRMSAHVKPPYYDGLQHGRVRPVTLGSIDVFDPKERFSIDNDGELDFRLQEITKHANETYEDCIHYMFQTSYFPTYHEKTKYIYRDFYYYILNEGLDTFDAKDLQRIRIFTLLCSLIPYFKEKYPHLNDTSFILAIIFYYFSNFQSLPLHFNSIDKIFKGIFSLPLEDPIPAQDQMQFKLINSISIELANMPPLFFDLFRTLKGGKTKKRKLNPRRKRINTIKMIKPKKRRITRRTQKLNLKRKSRSKRKTNRM